MAVDWDALWDKKGKSDSIDRVEVSGFEKYPDNDYFDVTDKLCRLIKVLPSDSVLEVGCSGGLIAQHLMQRCNYVGCDRAASIIKKTIEMNKISALRCDADNLIFKDKTFDHVFSWSVFQYFPDHAYARRAMSEMQRVARKTVCISDIPVASHEPSHLLYTRDFFEGWQLSEMLYSTDHIPIEKRRFTALLILD